MHVFIFNIRFFTSLLHVSVCYIHHLRGEHLITCTKPFAFYCVLCMLHFSLEVGSDILRVV